MYDSFTGLLREKMVPMCIWFHFREPELITGECLNAKPLTALIYEYGVTVAFTGLLSKSQ